VTPNNRMRGAVAALAIIFATSIAPAAETVWPKDSASDLSIFVTLLRFRIHADHCSAKVPQLTPQFESRLQDLGNRIAAISKILLASDAFKGMKDKPVPAEIIDAFQDSFDDTKHNIERQDAASVCPKTLQSFAAIDDGSLKSDLAGTLTALGKMIQNLEKQHSQPGLASP
jgi:hypothetical protein